ncbi:hypothetical protein A4U49_00020 (plasmid) [Acidithiobacillus ferrivorans]|uniref:hypothetical protein n=1 Tax=Acidithiobacillus ferrivorans TaxID=160808 RepID=UPI000B3B9B6A|nr:hypothetical protein [Acidithiobacillus ferrivorans]ARU59615.1 hypothetical protein A4U49_00020 [Acidithiobacillus ferrivorans]
MAKVNISEAARLVGKSRSHLYEKYINTGAITVETDREGRKVIDTSELIRVFGDLVCGDNTKDTVWDSQGHDKSGHKDSVISALQSENEVLREYLRAKEQEVAWLREQVGKTTALLTHQKDGFGVAQGKHWWWPW